MKKIVILIIIPFIAFFIIELAGCSNPSVSVPSGMAYLTGTISAPTGVIPSNRFLGVFIHTAILDTTNSGTNAAWFALCSSLPLTYTVGIEPGIYFVYAWLDYNGDLKNNSGDYSGWGGGIFPISPNITLEAGKTNICNISLSSNF